MAKNLPSKRKTSSDTKNKRVDEVKQDDTLVGHIKKELGYKVYLNGYSRDDGEKNFNTTKIQEAISVLNFFSSYEKIEIMIEYYIDNTSQIITHKIIFRRDKDKFTDIMLFLEKYKKILS